MGVGLKYDSTKFLVVLAVAALLYFLLLPSFWPRPSGGVDLPSRITYGSDLPVTVKVRCWHPNFSVRRIRLSINNVNSPALTDNRPLLPFNLMNREAKTDWTVGLAERLTFPRSSTFDLTAPLTDLSRRGKLRAGVLRGTVDIDVDYTEVSRKAGYPALSTLIQLPWEVEISR